MKRILGIARTAMVATTLAALPVMAQDAGTAGSRSGADTGYGAGTSQPMDRDMARTSPMDVDRDDDGFDLGWMGLLGLAGLAGLRRKRTDHTHDVRTSDVPNRL